MIINKGSPTLPKRMEKAGISKLGSREIEAGIPGNGGKWEFPLSCSEMKCAVKQ